MVIFSYIYTDSIRMKITIKQLSLLKLTMTKTTTNRFSGQNGSSPLLSLQI